mgnify:CR=1 FL=1
MKFILTLKICSALFMNCQVPIANTIEFNSWMECANAGYSNALEINNKLGSNFVNRTSSDSTSYGRGSTIITAYEISV